MSNVIPMNPAAGDVVVPDAPGKPVRPETTAVPTASRPENIEQHITTQARLADHYEDVRAQIKQAKQELLDATARDILLDADAVEAGSPPLPVKQRTAPKFANALAELERELSVASVAGRTRLRKLHAAVRAERDGWLAAVDAQEESALADYNAAVAVLQRAAANLGAVMGAQSWLRAVTAHEIPQHAPHARLVARLGNHDFQAGDIVTALAGAPERSRPKKPQTVTGREAKFGDAA